MLQHFKADKQQIIYNENKDILTTVSNVYYKYLISD